MILENTPSRSPPSKLTSPQSRTHGHDLSLKKVSPSSKLKRSPSQKDDLDLTAQDDNLEGQDIKFFNIPSQRSRPGSSKVRRSPGPGSARSVQSDMTVSENGRKPHKTIDPEEIVS